MANTSDRAENHLTIFICTYVSEVNTKWISFGSGGGRDVGRDLSQEEAIKKPFIGRYVMSSSLRAQKTDFPHKKTCIKIRFNDHASCAAWQDMVWIMVRRSGRRTWWWKSFARKLSDMERWEFPADRPPTESQSFLTQQQTKLVLGVVALLKITYQYILKVSFAFH